MLYDWHGSSPDHPVPLQRTHDSRWLVPESEDGRARQRGFGHVECESELIDWSWNKERWTLFLAVERVVLAQLTLSPTLSNTLPY